MEPLTEREWRLRRDCPDGRVAALAEEAAVSALAARLLCMRGHDTSPTADSFLNDRLSSLPDPGDMHGMETAVRRLVRALHDGEKILVHGDYDVDGITATALLVDFLNAAGAEVGYHIPLRLKDGYGLSAQAIDRAAAQGVSVVVSVDCGVTAVEEAELAGHYGIDLIITDHHQPPDVLPGALSIVNPHLPDCRFPDKNLAGVGVSFFLAVALRKGLREAGYFDAERVEPDLRHMLDLVALGTIADVVPLTGVNRILTRVGLQVLNGGGRCGVRALCSVSGVGDVDAGAVGFRLAPRLNAAGRIEDAALGVRLLLTEDDAEAGDIAALLDGFNRERQNVEARILRRAEQAVAELAEAQRSIVLADAEWHSGVVGIVASRLVDRYYRPTFLLAIEDGQAKGSGRSTRDVHLYRALCECGDLLKGFGGHAAAAGLSIDIDAIEPFAEAFERAVSAQSPDRVRPFVEYDGDVLLDQLSVPVVESLAQLAPFGMGNPAPLLAVRGALVSGVTIVGNRHLKFAARQGQASLSCIAFGMAGRQHELVGVVDLLCVPEINRWNGRIEVQLRIRDWKTAEE